MQSQTETMYFVFSGCLTSNSMRLKNLQIYENICNVKLFKHIAVDDVVYLAHQLQRTVKGQTHTVAWDFYIICPLVRTLLHDGMILQKQEFRII